MTHLIHRERFYMAMCHENPDRAVFDFCGSPQTIVDSPKVMEDLNKIFGLTGKKQGEFCVDERILCELDIDTRLVGELPVPPSIHSREENGIVYNGFGIGHRFINGHYEQCVNPLKDATLEEVIAYPLPRAADLDARLIAKWVEQARYLHEETDYAVVGANPLFGIFELGCWMFSFDDYLYRLAAEPEVVDAFSRRIMDYQKEVIEIYYRDLGKYLDCTTSGDDFGTQRGPFISKAMFERFVRPYYDERIAFTRHFTKAFFKHHTCGSVYDFIPSMIGSGVDILNPIQPGVHMMEHERLKNDYGDKIVFWGGVDTQHLLPNATPDEVKREIKRILKIMDKNGGFVLSTAHTVQPDVPAENLVAMFRGAKEYYQ